MDSLFLQRFIASQERGHRAAVDVLVAAASIAAAVLARIILEQIVGGIIPFLLTFPAVIAATLLAGTRAGIGAAIGCQSLTFWFVFPHWTPGRGGTPTDVVNLLLSCLSLAATIWAVASYRRLSIQLRGQCRREVQTLSLLIREMDHRTKNNFQIASNLLGLQAKDAGDEAVGRELDHASARLASIASVYGNLKRGIDEAEQVDLGKYLEDLIERLRSGFLHEGLDIVLRSTAVTLPAQSALMIGLIVNEWITNAVKYAFPDGHGTITVEARVDQGMLLVVVADNGQAGHARSEGTGSRLIDGLAKAIDAKVDVKREDGTHCGLRMRWPPRRSRGW